MGEQKNNLNGEFKLEPITFYHLRYLNDINFFFFLDDIRELHSN